MSGINIKLKLSGKTLHVTYYQHNGNTLTSSIKLPIMTKEDVQRLIDAGAPTKCSACGEVADSYVDNKHGLPTCVPCWNGGA